LIEGGLKMKKLLLVMLLALLSSFMFLGISQAGQCIYLGSLVVPKDRLLGEDEYTVDFYYDSSDVKYSGDIVSYVEYDNDACKEDYFATDMEIDCARRMNRHYGIIPNDFPGWSEWRLIQPEDTSWDVARQKLCR
jgi:hypothetical protein